MSAPVPVMRTPRSVELAITGRCNLRCSYCAHFGSAGDVDGDLPAREWLRFFEELGRCGVMSVTLQGGEPFCRGDLPELLEGVARNRMRFKVLTNGTLVDDGTARLLASSGRCDGVQVSIDGATPETHDSCRGAGSFERALAGIRHLRSRGVPVTVRVTIHRHNVGDLEAVARLLLDELGLADFSTNAASHIGLCSLNSSEVELTVGERSRAMAALLSLRRRYDGRITAAAGPLAEGDIWRRMERARRAGAASLSGGGALTGCGGVFRQIGVRADGVIVPCILLSHIELGRVNRDDLGTLWRTHPQLERLRSRRDVVLERFEFCRACEYIDYCTGSCPALAYTIVGDDLHPSPDACLKRFLEAGGRLPEDDEVEAADR